MSAVRQATKRSPSHEKIDPAAGRAARAAGGETSRQPHPRDNETTRLLCVAVHTDKLYRQSVRETVSGQPFTAASPSCGVDASLVADHAELAALRADARDRTLALTLVALVAAALATAWFVEHFVTGGLGLVGLLTRAGVLAVCALIVLAAGWCRIAVTAYAEAAFVHRHLTAGASSDLGWRAVREYGGQRLTTAGPAAEPRVVVFSGDKPFVGAGRVVRASSAAMPLAGVVDAPDEQPGGAGPSSSRSRDGEATGPRQRGRLAPTPFSARDLVDELTEAFRALPLQGLRVEERLYVNGLDVALFKELLPRPGRRPLGEAPQRLFDGALRTGHELMRHYLCVQTSGWVGHLITSYFVRIVKLPEMLFVESTALALAPLRDEFQRADRLPRGTVGGRIRMAASEATADLFPLTLGSLGRVVQSRSDARRGTDRQDLAVLLGEHGQEVDYGARTTLREAAARPNHGRYFIERDGDMHVKVLAQTMQVTLREFLAARGYDMGGFNFTQNVDFTDNSNNVVNFGSVGAVGTDAQGTASAGDSG